MKNKDRIWKDSKPMMFGMAVPDFREQPLKPLPDGCETPYDFFTLFMPDSFVDNMAEVSKRYAVRKGKPELQHKLTSNNIRISHAIMYMTGYISPSNRRMYWEEREDTRNTFVKNAMSRNTFGEVVRHTYFVDSVIPDPEDKFWKVRPLFDQLNSTAKLYVRQPERVSIDEGMIKYFGPHPLKQFMRGKPHRFGYKVRIFIIYF